MFLKFGHDAAEHAVTPRITVERTDGQPLRWPSDGTREATRAGSEARISLKTSKLRGWAVSGLKPAYVRLAYILIY